MVGLLLTGVGVAQVPAAPVVHAAYPAGVGTALGEQISGLLADPGASRAHWGIAVTAMDGTPIYGRSEGKLFRPASNAKLFTTAAAMALLGPDERLRTFVTLLTLHVGTEASPTSVAIEGDGDAYLSSRTVPYRSPSTNKQGALTEVQIDPLQFIEDAATAIAARGVHTVDGEIVGNDASWAYDPLPQSWSLEDTSWGYGAPVSALSINDNQLKLTLTPGNDIFHANGEDYHATALLYPDTGYYTLKLGVDTVAGQPANVSVRKTEEPHTLYIYGHIPPGAPYTTEISIDDPALFAAEALKAALIRRGLSVTAKARAVHGSILSDDTDPDQPGWHAQTTKQAAHEEEEETKRLCLQAAPNCSVVAEHVSSTLAEDVTVTLKESQNLHAELMLRRLADRYQRDATGANGTWVVRQWLLRAGVDGKDFIFYDGSGLSPKDLVTPRATVQLLAYAATQPWFATWKAALPVSGVDGTLGGRFKDGALKGKVFAKTGTLGESRALSGYVECASGKTVIFSVMADDHAPVGSSDRAVMDKIVAAIAATQ